MSTAFKFMKWMNMNIGWLMNLIVNQAHAIQLAFLLISVNLWTRSLFISTGGWCSMERGLVHYGFPYLISHWYSMHGTVCFIPDCRPCRLPKWQNTSDGQGPPCLSNVWCLHTCGVGIMLDQQDRIGLMAPASFAHGKWGLELGKSGTTLKHSNNFSLI